MINVTHAEASAAILSACDEGRLVQRQWHDRDGEGREIACLLGAIHPKVKDAADCNGDLMPMWLAKLTPTLFDGIPAADIFPIARRYGELVAHWHVLSAAQWDAILTRVLIRCIDDAVAAARPVSEGKEYWPAVAAACDQVKAALQSGDADELSAARSAATSAARSAGRSAAWSAASAARSAATSAATSAAYLSLFRFVLDQIKAECVLAEAA